MRITAYADRLLADLDRLDWPEPIKLQQRNWIGRSTGATIRFPTAGRRHRGLHDAAGHVVRRDVHGAGAGAPAGRRPDRRRPTRTTSTDALDRRRGDAARGGRRRTARRPTRKSEVERQTEHREKTGVWTGSYATNPATGEQIPIFVADYVLMGYGTGAIMAVPGPGRARLGVRRAVRAADRPYGRSRPPAGSARRTWATVRRSTRRTTRSTSTDCRSPRPRRGMIAWLEQTGRGTADRDVSPARLAVQPPALLGRAVPDRVRRGRRGARGARLDAAGRAARGRRLLAAHVRPRRRDVEPGGAAGPGHATGSRSSWISATARSAYRRETNTMPNWAGSCWYELRYLDPTNDEKFVDPGDRALLDRPDGGRATPAVSISTSAAASTPCCTCSTRGSGTRCCTTWATCRATSRSTSWSTRA